MNLTQTHPELISQWDFEKNIILPEQITAGSHKKVWWKCSVANDHCWEATVQNRTQNKTTCPCCCNRKTVPSNCLATTHPKLTCQWHAKNKLKPTEITAGYNKKVWWECNYGHIWESAVVNRTAKGNNCPYCDGKKADLINNLAKLHPHLLQEWDYDKNDISPENVRPQSKKKVWWKCKNNHQWQAVIGNRVVFKHNCPYCSGKKADLINNLAKLHPHLLQEWDYDKNDISPEFLLPASHRKVWWKCQIDSSHKWSATPLNRTIKKSQCPYCNSSSGERVIKNYLIDNNIKFSRQYRIPDCKNKRSLPFDFAVHLNNNIVLIEFQGLQHYEPINLYGGKDNFEKQKINDSIKRNYCYENNITLIEVKYNQIKDIPKLFQFMQKS